MNLQLKQLHDCYCKMTGFCANYRVYEGAWHHFSKSGYTENDLRAVLSYLLLENRRNRYAYSLKLSKLLDWQHHHFDALLCEARAKQRNRRPQPTQRDKVLSAYLKEVRPDEKPQPLICQSVKDVLRRIVQ